MSNKDHFIICIGRQFGSGGRQVGEKIAQKLGFSFYDKELINLASKESGLGKEFFEQADEKKRFGIFGGFLGLRTSIVSDDFLNNYLSNETLFKIQSDIIRELAEKQSCVFVGRCADYILREHKNTINVFITAHDKDRAERVLKRQELEKDKVQDLLEKTDKKRSNYYNYYTNKTWGAAASYDLCINTSLVGIDETVELICDIVKKKMKV